MPAQVGTSGNQRSRAERGAGEILREMEKHPPGPSPEIGNIVLPNSAPKLSDLGISKMQSSRWQMMVEIPFDTYPGYKISSQHERHINTRLSAMIH
ncbi:MAG: hypothetical protein ACLPVO_09400 [Desulfomonilaceae bacterium]